MGKDRVTQNEWKSFKVTTEVKRSVNAITEIGMVDVQSQHPENPRQRKSLPVFGKTLFVL